MLRVKVDTDNAAFADEDGPIECARILRQIADKIERGGTAALILDVNGNKVGDWKYGK